MTRTPGVVKFDGMIRPAAVTTAKALLKDGDTLEMDSYGGDPMSALRLAGIVLRRNIHVVVRYQYYDTCAQYVFLAARTKTVKRGGWVQFGIPARFIVEFVRSLPPHPPSAARISVEGLAAAEQDLYEEAGIDPGLVACFDDALRGRSLPRKMETKEDVAAAARDAMRADYVYFTKAALERYGVTGIEEFNRFPQTLAARNHESRDSGFRIAWVDETVKDCAQAPVTRRETAEPSK